MLKCSDDSYYVGLTNNLEQRIAEHNNKQASYFTATRLPVEVVFSQDFSTKDEALIIERQIKGWSRKKKEALINKDWKKITSLSKKDFKKKKNEASFDTPLTEATQDV
jgi:predicted GIY-YIG superfamily endonuclease